MRGLTTLLCAGILAFSWNGQTRGTNEKQDEITYSEKHVLVKYKAEIDSTAQKQFHKRYGTHAISQKGRGHFGLVSVPSQMSPIQAVKVFNAEPEVEWAQLDYTAYAFSVPNDPFYGYQWHMDQIRMPAAWELVVADSNVVVAILDTGVNLNGNDLDPFYVMDGYDFAYQDDWPIDGDGHGTHVTGTIAQTTDNGVGVAGVAYGVTILPVKVLDDDGSGLTSWIVDGLVYAADNGADVINMSLGYPVSLGDPGPALHEAITYAYQQGVTLVAASGNDGRRNAISYPAAYDEVIAVGAVRVDNKVPRYSNRGDGLELVAPGGDTSVDQNNDGYVDGVLQETFDPVDGSFSYYFFQGTSMAAPHVAGAVSLIISAGIDSISTIRTILQDSAYDLGDPGWDKTYGFGLLDVEMAMEFAQTPHIECTENSNCDDGDKCTEDVCINAGSVDSFCDSSPVGCGPVDGCCSSGCDETSDPDCSVFVTCGDGYCAGIENEENCSSCPEDCPSFYHPRKGSSCCGDGACTWRESTDNCSVDCFN